MKRLIDITIAYPKLVLIALSYLLAVLLFIQGTFDWIGHTFNGHGYVSMFLAGTLFSIGFTTPFGIGIFVAMAPQIHPLIGAPIAGLGALSSDFILFELLRFSFFDEEVHRFFSTRFCLWVKSLVHRETVSECFRRYASIAFAGMIIASPLPDELGVPILSSMTNMRARDFVTISYALNTLGIFLILLGTKAVQ